MTETMPPIQWYNAIDSRGLQQARRLDVPEILSIFPELTDIHLRLGVGQDRLLIVPVPTTNIFHYYSNAINRDRPIFLMLNYPDLPSVQWKIKSVVPLYPENRYNAYCKLIVELDEFDVTLVVRIELLEKMGLELTEELDFILQDQEYQTDFFKKLLTQAKPFERFQINSYYSSSSLSELCGATGIKSQANVTKFINYAIHKYQIPNFNPSGASKVHAQLSPFFAELKKEPILFYTYWAFCQSCAKTLEGVKLSSVFNAAFEKVTTYKDFVAILETIQIDEQDFNPWGANSFQEAIKKLPAYKEKRKTNLKRSTNRAFNKLMEDADFIDLDAKQFPRTKKAIESGEIPIGIFFRKKEQYFLLNNNFSLWEKMLKLYPEETKEIAQSASKRSTYEKDIMSYFYFILYTLPEYLKKHTKKTWTCIPKFVDSSTELSPPEDDGTGTVRSRSALTPIVDNETNTVIVPYASLAMPGRQTTYCYSHTYNVLHRGLSFNGNTVTNELEEKLNGKDDYGLMFYTLTGSEQGRGYPTFLIIFERLTKGTRVHFHRTHPCRSKDGDYNPIHNWINVCYNWMVGNVPKNRIINQQGDLCFIQDDQERTYTQQVTVYDNHLFLKPVDYAPCELKKKDNVLGYVKINQPTTLSHKEHLPIEIQPGTYIIRQCRSWEANPQGIWSLRID